MNKACDPVVTQCNSLHDWQDRLGRQTFHQGMCAWHKASAGPCQAACTVREAVSLAHGNMPQVSSDCLQCLAGACPGISELGRCATCVYRNRAMAPEQARQACSSCGKAKEATGASGGDKLRTVGLAIGLGTLGLLVLAGVVVFLSSVKLS